jgi:hypothetical protein
MLADPDTITITLVFDFEFSNAMPVQFACDVPWCLTSRHIQLETVHLVIFLHQQHTPP